MDGSLLQGRRSATAPFRPRSIVARRIVLVICCALVSWQLASLSMPRFPSTALAAPATEGPSADPASPVVCGYGHSHPIAEVHEKMLAEASALVASQRRPGIYWTLNDSKNDPI